LWPATTIERLNSTAQPFPLWRAFSAARIAHRSNIREWYCDQVPRPNTRPVNIKFLEWFRRDCDFRSTRSQIGWQCDRFATYRAASRTGRTLSLATLGGDACARAAQLGRRFQKNVFHRAGD
jgi:hypothetical protein